MAQKWEKENSAGGVPKKAAVEEGFASALQKSAALSPVSNPPAISLTRVLTTLASNEKTIQIEQNQSLFVKSSKAIVKFIATEDAKVTIESVDPTTIRILGVGIGSTFVHVWTATERTTFEVRVIPQKFTPSASQVKQQEAFDKSRSFKFAYDNSRAASYQGPKFRDSSRTSLDFVQNASIEGDTPYGALSAHAQTEKFQAKTLLTDAQVVLRDGKFGPLDNFDAALGDSRVTPNLIVFPGARVRGAEVRHWDDDKQLVVDSFYGREQSSIIGTLTPGLVNKRSLNSYLRGAVADYRINDDAKIKAGMFAGTGTSRADDLPKRGQDVKGEFKLGSHALFTPEMAYDDDHSAQKEAMTVKFDKIRMRGEFRNVNKKFQTLVGAPGGQGELGTLLEFNATPWDNVVMTGSFDRFRDRLIPNPEKTDEYNTHQSYSVGIAPWDTSNLTLNYQSIDDTARLGPSRQRVYGAQFNQRVQFLERRGNIFTRYQNRTNTILNNTILDYEDNQYVAGYSTTIFWGINFSVSEEINYLDEPNVPRSSRPRATIYDLNRSGQLAKLPFYYDVSLRIRDEEDTESINSFMGGNDTTEVSGGIYYREYDNLEIYLTGSFQNYVPESLTTTDPRVEFQFLTGVRYLYDTQYRWSAVGSFDGYVYKDLNGDGLRQATETGLPDVVVRTNDNREATTDKDGYYSFKSISGKNVTLMLDSGKIPYGYAPTSSILQQLPIDQGVTRHVDFGVTPRSEIAGIIFNDLDGNGKYDVTDKGVRKVKLKLENGTATRSNGLGAYSFPNAIAGEHTLTLDLSTLPEGYLPEMVPSKTFTVFEGIRYEQHFALRAVRQITGRVYGDKNSNRVLDSDEKGVEGISLRLGDKSMTTDKDGYFLFDELPSGSYQLSIDEKSLPAGSLKPENTPIVLSAEPMTLTDVNIGIQESRATAAAVEPAIEMPLKKDSE